MTKTYKFNYEQGKYTLMYSNPKARKEDAFTIDGDSMEFDTKKFYEYVFQDVKEKLDLKIINEMDESIVGDKIWKKGGRVYNIIQEMCEQIVQKMNEQCFE